MTGTGHNVLSARTPVTMPKSLAELWEIWVGQYSRSRNPWAYISCSKHPTTRWQSYMVVPLSTLSVTLHNTYTLHELQPSLVAMNTSIGRLGIPIFDHIFLSAPSISPQSPFLTSCLQLCEIIIDSSLMYVAMLRLYNLHVTISNPCIWFLDPRFVKFVETTPKVYIFFKETAIEDKSGVSDV